MNLPSIIEEVYKALQSLCKWGWEHGQLVLNTIAVVTALAVAWQFWFSSGGHQLVMFVGAPGSSTANVGSKLVREIARTRDSNGINFRIALEPTPENLSIRERMAFEMNRSPLGIVDDGESAETGQVEDLRALLPLEWDYLYVLCSRALLDEVARARSAAAAQPGKTAQPAQTPTSGKGKTAGANQSSETPADEKDEKDVQTLADVINYVNSDQNKHKVFLGPSNTSSFKMAKFALKEFGSISESHLLPGIPDWDAVRVFLNTGELGLVFYSGPLGDEFIDDVASDNKAVLLGLGDITDAIQHGSGFQVYAATLPANLGAAKVHDKPAADTENEPPVAFCRGNPTTLACRRVLACPRSLPTADAYLLASAALATLVEQEYYINLTAEDRPHNDPGKTVPVRLRMPPHPALKLLQDGKMPFVWRQWGTWPGWLQTIVSVLLGLLAIDALRLLTKRIDSKKKEGYARIEKTLGEYEKAIDEKTHREIAEDLARWDVQMRDLRREIHRARDVTEAERESLLKRCRALEFEIQSSPRWVAEAPLVREQNEPAAEGRPTATPGTPPG